MKDKDITDVEPNTHLAAEYYVMSMLHRIGADAVLTLENKKAVDIIVNKNGKSLTIDVKGLKSTTSFPFDNCDERRDNHYYVFVSFLDKITKTTIPPRVYIVPSQDLDKFHTELKEKDFIYQNPNHDKKRVQYGTLKKLKTKYLNKWEVFI